MKRTKIAVLDDYDGSISQLPCWKEVVTECEVEFFREAQEPKNLPLSFNS